MIETLTSLKRYFYEKSDSQQDHLFYYRRRKPSDNTNFQPCCIEQKNGTLATGRYFNPKTREITHSYSLDNGFTASRYGFEPYQVFKTVLKGTALGFAISGVSNLLGYHIITVVKGTMVGFSISSAKAFWDSLGWDDNRIYVCNDEEIISRVRHLDGTRWNMQDDEKVE